MAKAKRIGPDLPRLSAQRPHLDGGGAAVAARPARRDGVDAADLEPGEAGLDPKNYTIRTAPALLKKTKAWDDYCDAEQPLAPAIKKLK